MAYSGITRVQETWGTSLSNTLNLSLSSTPMAGNLLVIFAGGTGTGITNSTSGWTAITGGNDTNKAWYKLATGGGSASDSPVITQTGSAPMVGFIMEYNGLYGAVPGVFACSGVNAQAAGSYTSTANLATTMSTGFSTYNNLFISCVGMKVASGASVPTSPTYTFGRGSGSGVDTKSITNAGQSGIAMFYGDGQSASSMTDSPTLKVSWTNAATDTNHIILGFHSTVDPFLISAGAIAVSTSGTVSPTFGQSTTAGNMVSARVKVEGSTTAPSTPSGWTLSKSAASGTNNSIALIYHKLNCSGSETAPSFTVSGSTSICADLAEYANIADVSALDKSGSGNPTTGCTAVDSTASDLAVAVWGEANSKTATYTVSTSWSPTGGIPVAEQNTGATKQAFVFVGSAYLLGSQGGVTADQVVWSCSQSTGTPTGAIGVIASFKPPTVVSGFAVTAGLGARTIKLTWTTGSGNATFKIERSPDGSTSWTTLQSAWATDGVYWDTTCSPSTTYYYRVSGSTATSLTSVLNATTSAVTSWSNTFEGGTNGTTITLANSGGTSGHAFDVASGNASNIYSSSAAYGGSSLGFNGTTTSTDLMWQAPGANGSGGVGYVRVYLRPHSGVTDYLLASSGSVIQWDSSTTQFACNAGATSLSTVGTTTHGYAAGQWVRIEMSYTFDGNTYSVEFRFFATPSSTTPTETITGTFADLNDTPLSQVIQFRSCDADYVAWTDDTWIGPVAFAPAAPTGVAVSGVSGGLTTTWTDETTGSPTSKYAVLRSTDNATFYQIDAGIAAGTQTYADSGNIQYPVQMGAGQLIGHDTTTQRLAGSVAWPGGTVTTVSLWLAKSGSPTDNVVVQIQSDSAGAPSGTVLATGSTVAASSLTTSFVKTAITFNASISAQTFWIVVSRSGSLDASNYPQVEIDTTQGNPDTAGGTVYYDGSWHNNFADLVFDVATSLSGGTTYYYKVKAYNSQGTATSTSASGVFPSILSRTGSDTAAATDSVARTSARARTVSDSAGVADASTVARQLALLRAVTGSAPATDVAGPSGTRARATSDTEAATDSVARVSARARATSDSLPLTDLAKRAGWFSNGSDTAAATDVAAQHITVARTISDSESATEAATRAAARFKTGTDSSPATDAATRALTHLRGPSDSAPATDVTGPTGTRARTSSDSAPATDAVTRQRAASRTGTDSEPATDAVARVLAHVGVATDTAPTVESLSRSAELYARTTIDSLGISEIAGPATQRTTYLRPDSMVTETNFTGSYTDLRDSPDAVDTTWVTGAALQGVLHVTMEDPPANLLTGAGRQRIRVRVRPH